MKRLKLFSLILFASLSSIAFAQTKPSEPEKGQEKIEEFTKEFYENGNLKSIIPNYVFKGPSNGAVKLYHENGNLFIEGTVKKYGHTGLWKFYDENENISYAGTYEKGDKVGEWLTYDINGKVLSKEINHDYINNLNNDMHSDSTYINDKSQIYFTDKQDQLVPYTELENGKNYRIIDFKDNEPSYDKNFKPENDDLSVKKEEWGSISIKFHKKVKLIRIDFFDDGCWEPYTEFRLKNSIRKEVYFVKNSSFWTQNVIFNDPKVLSKTTFLELDHCEGGTNRITVIYE